MTTDLQIYPYQNTQHFWEIQPKITFFKSNEQKIIAQKPIEILFITSYPPRECGIATYTQDLINALSIQFNNSITSNICALETDNEHYTYPKNPKFILNTDKRNSFAKTLFNINRAKDLELVVIQHEFGFFSAKEDEFNVFIKYINKPILFVFHTVLPNPDVKLKLKVQNMGDIASSIVVMTQNASDILTNDYGIDALKITVIPHGTHLVPALEKKN